MVVCAEAIRARTYGQSVRVRIRVSARLIAWSVGRCVDSERHCVRECKARALGLKTNVTLARAAEILYRARG